MESNMKRSLIAIAALAFSLVPVEAAPPPKGANTSETEGYYPTKAGTKWVYSRKSGPKGQQKEIELTYVITEAAEKDGTKIITQAREVSVRLADGTPLPSESVPEDRFAVSGSGVFRTETKFGDPRKRVLDKLEPPQPLIKLPIKPGETWEYTTKRAELEIGVKCKTVGLENVEVPAGKYKTLRIEEVLSSTSNGRQFTSTQSFWYAPGIGRVKSEEQTGVKELKSFTPGKD
jgi:hypothetical protein